MANYVMPEPNDIITIKLSLRRTLQLLVIYWTFCKSLFVCNHYLSFVSKISLQSKRDRIDREFFVCHPEFVEGWLIKNV